MEYFPSRLQRDMAEKELDQACRKLFYNLHTHDKQLDLQYLLKSIGNFAWDDYQACEMALLNLEIVRKRT